MAALAVTAAGRLPRSSSRCRPSAPTTPHAKSAGRRAVVAGQQMGALQISGSPGEVDSYSSPKPAPPAPARAAARPVPAHPPAPARTLLQVGEAGWQQAVQLRDERLHGHEALPGPPVAPQPLDGRRPRKHLHDLWRVGWGRAGRVGAGQCSHRRRCSSLRVASLPDVTSTHSTAQAAASKPHTRASAPGVGCSRRRTASRSARPPRCP